MNVLRGMAAAVLLLAAGTFPALSQSLAYPGQKNGVYVAKDFRFHTGETIAEVNLAYTTLGNPSNEAVLILHGTAGSAQTMLTAGFAGQLFGPGQPLDAAKYFIILPDALGAGKSSKPSDGLKAKFPKYNYDDMVDAQYRLVTEGLGIKHLRLVLGNSMGGMHAWVWGTRYPLAMDAIVPMASQPTEMSSRNWMMRRLMIETIRADPDYLDGNYTTQPKFLKIANVFYGTGTNGGDLAYQRLAPTREKADALVDARLQAPAPSDANDFIWQWAASADYNPAAKLGTISAAVLAINSEDDERNPASTGLMVDALKKVKSARLYLIPASPMTSGHGTTGGQANLWAPILREFLEGVPRQ